MSRPSQGKAPPPLPRAPPVRPRASLVAPVSEYVNIQWKPAVSLVEDTDVFLKPFEGSFPKFSVMNSLLPLVLADSGESVFTGDSVRLASCDKLRKFFLKKQNLNLQHVDSSKGNGKKSALDKERAKLVALALGGSMGNRNRVIFFRQFASALIACNYQIATTELMYPILQLLKTLTPEEFDGVVRLVEKESAQGKPVQSVLDNMEEADVFIWEIAKVPMAKARMECMIFEQSFDDLFGMAVNSLTTIYQGLEVLEKNKNKLEKFFMTVLAIGNSLNQGTLKLSKFSAFSLTTLTKLCEVKSSLDSRVDLLHFILHEHGDTVFTEPDLRALKNAANLRCFRVREEVKDLMDSVVAISEIKDQVTLSSEEDVFGETMAKFSNRIEPEISWLSQFAFRVFASYRNLCVFFQDAKTTYPPPKEKTGEQMDLIELFAAFGTLLRSHEKEMKKFKVFDSSTGLGQLAFVTDDPQLDAIVEENASPLASVLVPSRAAISEMPPALQRSLADLSNPTAALVDRNTLLASRPKLSPVVVPTFTVRPVDPEVSLSPQPASDGEPEVSLSPQPASDGELQVSVMPQSESARSPLLEPVKPVSIQHEKPVSPWVQASTPVSPLVHAVEAVEPLEQPIKPVSPLVLEEKPVSPLAHQQRPVSPFVQQSKPVSPLVQASKPVSPLVQPIEPVKPSEQATIPVSPLVLHEIPVSPLAHPEKPIYLLVPIKPVSPILHPLEPTVPLGTATKLLAPVEAGSLTPEFSASSEVVIKAASVSPTPSQAVFPISSNTPQSSHVVWPILSVESNVRSPALGSSPLSKDSSRPASPSSRSNSAVLAGSVSLMASPVIVATARDSIRVMTTPLATLARTSSSQLDAVAVTPGAVYPHPIAAAGTAAKLSRAVSPVLLKEVPSPVLVKSKIASHAVSPVTALTSTDHLSSLLAQQAEPVLSTASHMSTPVPAAVNLSHSGSPSYTISPRPRVSKAVSPSPVPAASHMVSPVPTGAKLSQVGSPSYTNSPPVAVPSHMSTPAPTAAIISHAISPTMFPASSHVSSPIPSGANLQHSVSPSYIITPRPARPQISGPPSQVPSPTVHAVSPARAAMQSQKSTPIASGTNIPNAGTSKFVTTPRLPGSPVNKATLGSNLSAVRIPSHVASPATVAVLSNMSTPIPTGVSLSQVTKLQSPPYGLTPRHVVSPKTKGSPTGFSPTVHPSVPVSPPKIEGSHARLSSQTPLTRVSLGGTKDEVRRPFRPYVKTSNPRDILRQLREDVSAKREQVKQLSSVPDSTGLLSSSRRTLLIRPQMPTTDNLRLGAYPMRREGMAEPGVENVLFAGSRQSLSKTVNRVATMLLSPNSNLVDQPDA